MEETNVEKNDSTKKLKPRGGHRPGSGRKPDLESARKAGIVEGYAIARTEFWLDLAQNKALPRLQEILDSPLDVIGGKTLMTAVVAVIDRALGKPKESHELTGKDGGPLQVLAIEYQKPNHESHD